MFTLSFIVKELNNAISYLKTKSWKATWPTLCLRDVILRNFQFFLKIFVDCIYFILIFN